MSEELYGFVVTSKGRNLFAKLVAGNTLHITRIMFGTGKLPEDATVEYMMQLEDLVEPLAPGVSTTPIYEEDTVSLVCEFRSDLNGGLKETVWLNEFGIFANDPDLGEVMIAYATLGSFPDNVRAYKDGRITVRDYPVSITIGAASNVVVDFSASAFITSDEAENLINAGVIAKIEELSEQGELVTREDVTKIVEEEIEKHPSGGGYYGSYDITIPANGWEAAQGGGEDYSYKCDVTVTEAKGEFVPSGACRPGSFGLAASAGVMNGCEVFDGYVRFYAKNKPADDINATLILFSRGAEPVGGIGAGLEYDGSGKVAVKAGEGVSFDENGALTVDKQEVVTESDMLDEDETENDLREILLT